MNLVPLFEEALEFQNYNGTVLSNGKVAVFYIGRTRLADIFNDIEGLSPAENPKVLDNLGMGPIYVNPAFDYEMVVYDAYDNELFSVKKYVLSKGEHSTANVVVTPSEHIAVSAWTIGDVQVYMPYIVGDIGKTYEGILPIVVNNDVNRISANHIPLGVQDPLYFVEDSETACILGCSAQTEIPAELSGKWDEASDAVIANSAQWAEGTEYEAGNYISIDNNTISVVNLPTSADVQNIVDVATSGLMPSGDYLTKESADTLYAPTGNYLTGLPEDLVYSADITGFATTAELDNKLDKADSANFYPMESNPSGYLTAHQSLDDYATKQWVEDKGYITGVDIPESANWNSTYNTVHDNSGSWTGGGVTGDYELSAGSGISIVDYPLEQKTVISVTAQGGNPEVEQAVIDNSATWDSVTAKADSTAIPSLDGYATEDWVTAQGYLTAETDWSDTITAASANAYNEATAAIPTGLATTADLQTVSGEITAMIPSTAGLATQDWVTGQGYITGVDLTPYQTTAGMTAYLTTGDSAEFMTTAERSDYIPTGVSSEFYTTANTANYISAVPDTYLQNTDLSTEDGKVTAISGIPLSAGGDVPEGVMVESGLEYNAVNEISGYNGSAIAQYGAEKQFLTHDDTLVHLSNSAQYALGVALPNISADLARMLGVDETVLWSGATKVNTANTITLSEPLTAFSKFRVYDVPFRIGSSPYLQQPITETTLNNVDNGQNYLFGTVHGWVDTWYSTASGSKYRGYCFYSGDSDLTHILCLGSFINSMGSSGKYDMRNEGYIYQIVGIGRKQS